MMGFNHRLVTGSFVFAFTGSFSATAIACSGAAFPDSIEKIIPISLICYFFTTSGVFY